MESIPCDVGISANVSVAGFFNFDVSGGTLDLTKVIESGITVTASASASFDFPIWYIFYATFSLGSEGGFTLKYTNTSKGSFVDNLSAEVFFNLTASAGVGAKVISKKVASLELGLNGKIGPKFKIPAKNLKECMTVTANLSGYIKANLWKLSGSIPINLVDLSLYPTLGVTFLDDPKLKKAPAKPSAAYSLDYEDLTIVPRNYLEARSAGARRVKALAPAAAEQFAETAAYPYGYPHLIAFGGNLMAVWVDDDGGKADADANTLYYAVFNGTSWSAAAPVYENGTADFEAEIATDGNTVYAVWQRATKAFGNTAEIEDFAENTELVFAEYKNGSWSIPIPVDGVNDLVTDYAIFADSQAVAVAWAENDAYDCFGETGTNTVRTASFSDGVWAAPTIIAEETNLPDLNSLAVGALNGEIAVGYCGAQSFFLNGEAIIDAAEDAAAYACKYQNGAFYFISDEGLTRFDGETAESIAAITKQDYKVLSNGSKSAVLYTVEDGFKNELYICYEDDEGVLTDPVALTNFGKHISSYDAIMNADGTVTVAADVENLAAEGAEYPYTTTDFIVTQIGDYVSVRTEDSILYDAASIQPGAAVDFKAAVRNLGTADVNEFHVQLLDDAGQILKQATIRQSIASGESGELTLNYRLPSALTRTKLKMIVTANGDTDLTDNTAEAEFGFANLAIENYAITDNGVIIARVVNQGFESAENVSVDISKYDEGESTLTTLEVGTLAPNERKSITYTVAEDQIVFSEEKQRSLFLIKAEAEATDSIPVQAVAEVSLYPTAVEAVALNREVVELALGKSFALFAEVSPLTAFDKSIHWMSTDTAVATVDENGEVTAAGTDTATITAITANSDVVAHCAVIVKETTASIPVTGLELDQSALELVEGTQSTVNATVSPANATYPDVIWTSDNEEVAMVSQAGTIVALSRGSATIKAKTADGNFEKAVAVTVVPETHAVQWIVDGKTETEIYCVGDVINQPENPALIGHTFTGWTPAVPDVMPAEDLTFTAVFEPNVYTATVIADGEVIAEIPFTYGQKSIQLPDVPKKEGHTGAWPAYTLDAENITIEAVYTPIEYTVTYYADDQVIGSGAIPYGNSIWQPRTPQKEGYTFTGWTPAVPERMPANDLTFYAVFEPVTYYATFMADGKQVGEKIPYTLEAAGITPPAVPEKAGYTGQWENYTLAVGGVTINAVYTKNETPPALQPTIKIKNFTANKSVDYKTTITFTAVVTDAPTGAQVHWFIDGKDVGTGETYTKDKATASYAVQCKLIQGSTVLAESEVETVKVNTGFFAKLIAFFKGLFGSLPVITQAIKETL